MSSLKHYLLRNTLLTAAGSFIALLAMIAVFFYFAVYLQDMIDIRDSAKNVREIYSRFNGDQIRMPKVMNNVSKLIDGDLIIYNSAKEVEFTTNAALHLERYVDKISATGSSEFLTGFLDVFRNEHIVYGEYIADDPRGPGKVIILAVQPTLLFGFAINVLVVVFILAVILTTLLYLTMRGITRRVSEEFDNISRGAARLAAGIYTVPVHTDSWLEFRMLANSVNKMANDVEASITELQKERDRVRDAYDREAAFSANVAHELRTPLTGMLANAEVIELMTTDIYDAKELARYIKKDAVRMSAMCENMLDLAKLENGQIAQALILKPACISKLLQEIAHNAASKWQDKQQAIHVDCAEELHWDTDSQLLYQLLYNVVDNACKYSDANSTIHISATLHNDQKSLAISVRDHGSGIEAESIKHLFDRFYRVDKSRARKIAGAGLGLSLVKQMVNILNGEIKVFSTVGIGTEFVVTFSDKGELYAKSTDS